MDNNTINGLRDALKHSPDNVPLRLLLADALMATQQFEEAETTYKAVLEIRNDDAAKKGLACVFFHKGNYSACNVIIEEMMREHEPDIPVLVLYAKSLLKENAPGAAADAYQRVLAQDPGFVDEELTEALQIKVGADPVDVWLEEPDTRFLQKPDVNFSDVGGMEQVKKEIGLKIIKPLTHAALYEAYGKKMGGGILLYGPPGCGKTFIAKATAGEVNARFISVSLSDILDMWVGNSEKNLHELFELARQSTPCVLFIDEIDALGASRSDMKQSAGRHLINQFLQELDGIDNSNDGVLILGATNTPWNLDPAFRRPGRFDRIIFVPPPDEISRTSILKLKLKNKPLGTMDYAQVAKKMEYYSGADIDAAIDIAIEQKLEEAFGDGVPRPLETKDLLQAQKKHKPSTQEWFMTARNFALFANDAGLYDDILTYMKIKK